MKIVKRVQVIRSRHNSVTDGMTDRLRDRLMKAIPIIPHPLCSRELKLKIIADRFQKPSFVFIKMFFSLVLPLIWTRILIHACGSPNSYLA